MVAKLKSVLGDFKMNNLIKLSVVKKEVCCLVVGFITSFILLLSSKSFAEDIELYLSETIKQAQARPQVLLIFDNSGSMSTQEEFKKDYDPNITYPAVGGLNALSERFIYFTKGGIDGVSLPVPDSPSEARRFLDDINSCQTARDILATEGIFTGQIREYTFQGNSGRWVEIPDNNGANIEIIDCEADVLSSNPKNAGVFDKKSNLNPLPDGYPVDGKGSKGSPQYHAATTAESNVSWSGPTVTLYTDNYLRYHQSNSIGTESKSRLEVAKASVSSIIKSTPNIDFGLQVFNRNNDGYSRDGGRVVFGIQESTASTRSTLLDIVNKEIGHDTWTPLCETLYEAYNYFAGNEVDFGDNDDVFSPRRDKSVENGKNYITPFSPCSDKVYVILITDGEPTYDIDADSKIRAIPAADQDPMGVTYKVSDSTKHDGPYNMLPALAGWMYNNDVNDNLDGKQIVETYTIGFGKDIGDDQNKSAEKLLIKTATEGGGKYFYAKDTATLTAALVSALSNLEPINDTLTSASVAANNFDRTQTLDSVYYAMFQPDRGPRWQGNVKKYRLVGNAQKGKFGKDAITSKGLFDENVTSYWSSEADGDTVGRGGVAEMLRGLTSKRNVYSDLGANGALVPLTQANAIATSAFGSTTALANALGVADDAVIIDEYLDWAVGLNVDNEQPFEGKPGDPIPFMRPDVFGDPLHSKPVVINYGNDNIYIAVGTNQGALHLFKDEAPKDISGKVTETWAFMPKDLFSNIRPLRENFTNSEKVYGVDGLITSHIIDKDGDGVVDVSDGDEVWLFFGLRRGGSSYYALDLTNPGSPKKLWQIKGGSGDFIDLGQTWSQPKVAYSLLNVSGGTTAEPVLVFGGGYDINKDSSGVGTDDTVGKAVYMVDAKTGSLLWSETSSLFTDSIPSSITPLDSTGNGMLDRLYFGDTGGNVWRADLAGKDKSKFTVFKLASLGSESTNDGDRRFFYEPTVVRAFISETTDTGQKDKQGESIVVQTDVPYDAVLLGSGDRSNPLGNDSSDVYFMIKDENIKSQEFTASSVPPIPSPILLSDLYDFTDNPFGQTLSEQDFETLSLKVSEKSGWYVDFTQSGEKSSSSGLVINNVAYFTSYTPPDLTKTPGVCNMPSGAGWLYAIDLSLGVKKYNWLTEDNDSGLNRENRIRYISEQFLGSPTLIVTDHDKDNSTDPEGNIITGRTVIPVGFNLQTLRNYLTVEED